MMRQWFEALVHQLWYPPEQKSGWYFILIGLLWPFSYLYRFFLPIRRFYLKHYKQTDMHPPVCVVGNITVGGTGKTPFVIFIVKLLKEHGFKPGIVSRGYAGNKANSDIIILDRMIDVHAVGEEPLLIYQKTGCPVVVGCKRNEAISTLCAAFPDVDIIVSDDGLQHYAMKREIEFALLDGNRLWGNGFCLPAGPLREPLGRLNTVDYLIIKETKEQINLPNISAPIFNLSLKYQPLYCLSDPSKHLSLSDLRGQTIHAVAGIANPQSFFHSLRVQGLYLIEHIFHDHYFYQASDFVFEKKHLIIMTEKDAIKCQAIAQLNPEFEVWVLPIEAEMPSSFCEQIVRRLQHG